MSVCSPFDSDVPLLTEGSQFAFYTCYFLQVRETFLYIHRVMTAYLSSVVVTISLNMKFLQILVWNDNSTDKIKFTD